MTEKNERSNCVAATLLLFLRLALFSTLSTFDFFLCVLSRILEILKETLLGKVQI